MTWEEFFDTQEQRDNGARAVLVQPFEHEEKATGRKISLKLIGNTSFEIQVDDYICVFNQETGEFRGTARKLL